jgi:hypothetical protein
MEKILNEILTVKLRNLSILDASEIMGRSAANLYVDEKFKDTTFGGMII